MFPIFGRLAAGLVCLGVSSDVRTWDSTELSALLRSAEPPRRGQLVADSRVGSDADVHQRRHGAVQAGLPRRGARGHPRRHHDPEVHASRASTTTSRTSAAPPATTPSSRCSATSPSATTSSTRPSTWAWELVTGSFGIDPRTWSVNGLREDDEAHDDLARGDRPPRVQGLPPRRGRELLVHGRHGSLRSLLGDPLRLRRETPPGLHERTTIPPASAGAGSRSGTWSSCSSTAMRAGR